MGIKLFTVLINLGLFAMSLVATPAMAANSAGNAEKAPAMQTLADNDASSAAMPSSGDNSMDGSSGDVNSSDSTAQPGDSSSNQDNTTGGAS